MDKLQALQAEKARARQLAEALLRVYSGLVAPALADCGQHSLTCPPGGAAPHLLAAGVGAHEAHHRQARLGARVDEADHLHGGHALNHHLGQHVLRSRGTGGGVGAERGTRGSVEGAPSHAVLVCAGSPWLP